MRALCGAIIAAGAMIGLGLLAIGIGTRYSGVHYIDPDTLKPQWVMLRHLDTALLITLVVGLLVLVIGLAVAFVGLAYHHHRRHLEMQHHLSRSGDRPPAERITV